MKSNHRNESWAATAIALFAVYLFWGSTYIAIRIGIETISPLVLGGIRHTIAGVLLFLATLVFGQPRPNSKEIRAAILCGILTAGIGNGALIWSEQRVPSSLAAMMLATVPVWLIVLNVFVFGGQKPKLRAMLGMGLGLIGTLGIVIAGKDLSGMPLRGTDLAILFVGSGSWALGSLMNRQLQMPRSNWISTSIQMMSGGILLTLAATLHGDWGSLAHSPPSASSLWALAYLVVFGSWVGFSAYTWLSRHVDPHISGTYAFVNPMVALILGFFIGGEKILLSAGIFSAITVLGVALIVLPGRGRKVKLSSKETPC